MLKTQHSFSSFINSIAASVFYVLHTFKNALGGRGMPLWTPYLTYTFVSTPYKSLKQSTQYFKVTLKKKKKIFFFCLFLAALWGL